MLQSSVRLYIVQTKTIHLNEREKKKWTKTLNSSQSVHQCQFLNLLFFFLNCFDEESTRKREHSGRENTERERERTRSESGVFLGLETLSLNYIALISFCSAQSRTFHLIGTKFIECSVFRQKDPPLTFPLTVIQRFKTNYYYFIKERTC